MRGDEDEGIVGGFDMESEGGEADFELVGNPDSTEGTERGGEGEAEEEEEKENEEGDGDKGNEVDGREVGRGSEGVKGEGG
jgi:hypothetical protein